MHILKWTLFVAGLALSTQAAVVRRAKPLSDGRDFDWNNDKGPTGPRNFNLNGGGEKLVDIKSSNAKGNETFRFRVGFNGVPSVRLSYHSGVNSSDPQKPAKFDWRVGFLYIAEVSPSAPSIVRNKIRLGGRPNDWSRPNLTSGITDIGGQSTFTTTSTFEQSGTKVTLSVTASDFQGTLDGVPRRPNAIKYTLDISNFPYTLPDGQLVIAKGIFASKSVQRAENSSARITVGGGGLFSWDSTVNLSGNATSTVSLLNDLRDATSAESADVSIRSDDQKTDADESVKVLLFKVNATRPAFVRWDPEAALASDLSNVNDTSSSSSARGRSVELLSGSPVLFSLLILSVGWLML